ncbi:MAG: nucleoside recognition protein [candidate division WOR-3 bacterium]
MIIVNYLKGISNLGIKTFVILFVVFILLEIIQRSGIIRKGYQSISKAVKFMGFSVEGTAPLLAGIILGIIYGAGVIDDLIKQGSVDKRQVFLVSVFLSMCHAIFEDTGLFLMLGASLFWITVPRLLLAIIVTFIISKITK